MLNLLPITEQLLTVGPNRPGDKIIPKLIIVHRTGNPNSTALQNRNYFESLNHPPYAGKIYASAHYIVDAGNIIRCIPEQERAHHCIGANQTSIGIETFEPFNQQAYRNMVDLVVDICRRYRFQPTPQFIQSHSKYDPANRPYDPFSWSAYTVGRAMPGRDLFDPFKFYQDVAAGGGGLV